MTDITPKQDVLSKISSPLKQKGKQAPSTGLAIDFSKVLMDQIGCEAPETTASDLGGLPELDATYRAGLAQLTDTAAELTQEVSLSIDRLETYAQWLSDPGKTLRQAFGLLEEIEGSLTALTNRLKDVPDSELKGIADHISTLVAVEKIKLNRGDYS